MNNDIMELSNIMVYKGKLKAFDDTIGYRKLKIDQNAFENINNNLLKYCINPENSVVFVNTSGLIKETSS